MFCAFLHRDPAIGLTQRQHLRTLRRDTARPSAWIAGLALAELRVHGRLAIAYPVGDGFVFAGSHGFGVSRRGGEMIEFGRGLPHIGLSERG